MKFSFIINEITQLYIYEKYMQQYNNKKGDNR